MGKRRFCRNSIIYCAVYYNKAFAKVLSARNDYKIVRKDVAPNKISELTVKKTYPIKRKIRSFNRWKPISKQSKKLNF
jgi:hypothetical protein